MSGNPSSVSSSLCHRSDRTVAVGVQPDLSGLFNEYPISVKVDDLSKVLWVKANSRHKLQAYEIQGVRSLFFLVYLASLQ